MLRFEHKLLPPHIICGVWYVCEEEDYYNYINSVKNNDNLNNSDDDVQIFLCCLLEL